MGKSFQIEFKESDGDLHVRPKGDLDGSSAWELINLIHEKYNGRGRVIIDTHDLREICAFGRNTFQCRLDRHRLPVDRLLFKGKKGVDMAPEGSRVYIKSEASPCGCKGDCANCGCTQGQEQEALS